LDSFSRRERRKQIQDSIIVNVDHFFKFREEERKKLFDVGLLRFDE